MKKVTVVILFVISLYAFGALGEEATCLQSSHTQSELNACSGLSYQEVNDELNRVYQEIRSVYADDKEFLLALETSQQAWLVSRDADTNLYFPLPDKRWQYGSVYVSCLSSVEQQLTLQRIVFLKQWLTGVEEDEVCAGSIKRM